MASGGRDSDTSVGSLASADGAGISVSDAGISASDAGSISGGVGSTNEGTASLRRRQQFDGIMLCVAAFEDEVKDRFRGLRAELDSLRQEDERQRTEHSAAVLRLQRDLDRARLDQDSLSARTQRFEDDSSRLEAELRTASREHKEQLSHVARQHRSSCVARRAAWHWRIRTLRRRDESNSQTVRRLEASNAALRAELDLMQKAARSALLDSAQSLNTHAVNIFQDAANRRLDEPRLGVDDDANRRQRLLEDGEQQHRQRQQVTQRQQQLREQERLRLYRVEQERKRQDEQERRWHQEQERLRQQEQEQLRQQEQEQLQQQEQEQLRLQEQERLRQQEQEQLRQQEQEQLRQQEQEQLRQQEQERLRLQEQERLRQQEQEQLRQQEQDRLRQEEEDRERKEQEQLRQQAQERLRHQEQERLRHQQQERLHLQEQERLHHQEQELLRHQEQERLRRGEQERLRQQEQERLRQQEQERLRLQEEEIVQQQKQEQLHKQERLRVQERERLQLQETERLRHQEQEQSRQEEQERVRQQEDRERQEQQRRQEQVRSSEQERLKQQEQKRPHQKEHEREQHYNIYPPTSSHENLTTSRGRYFGGSSRFIVPDNQPSRRGSPGHLSRPSHPLTEYNPSALRDESRAKLFQLTRGGSGGYAYSGAVGRGRGGYSRTGAQSADCSEAQHIHICHCSTTLGGGTASKENRPETMCTLCAPVPNSNFSHRPGAGRHGTRGRGIYVRGTRGGRRGASYSDESDECRHDRRKVEVFIPATSTVVIERHRVVP